MSEPWTSKVGLEFEADGVDQAARKIDGLAETTRDVGRATDEIKESSSRATKAIEDDTARQKRSWADVTSAVNDHADKIALAGAGVGAATAVGLDSLAGAQGRLQAQLNLTEEETERVGDVAREVFVNNFGDSLEQAGDTVALFKGSLRDLSDDDLQYVSQSVLALEDPFGGVGADAQIMVEDVRAIKANFPGMSEVEIIDLIASGFQSGAGNSGDLQDTLQEYPGDFSRIGLEAADMFGIIEAGADAGIRNTDILADGVREMAIRIVEEGGEATEALNRLFPADEAERLRADFAAGGEAGRDAFFDILAGLNEVEDPIARNTAGAEIMGTKWEDAANQMPAVLDALKGIRDGSNDATGAAEALNAQYENGASTLETWRRQLTTGTLGAINDVAGGTGELAVQAGTALIGLKGMGVDLGTVKDKAAGAVGPVGSLGGKLALYGGYAIGVSAVANALADVVGVGQDTGKLAGLTGDLETLVATGSSANLDDSVYGVEGLGKAFDYLADPSLSQNVGAFTSRTVDLAGQVATFGQLDVRGSIVEAERSISALDGSLAELVQSGNPDVAVQAFREVADAAADQGVEVEQMLTLLPGFSDQLATAGISAEDLAGPLDSAATAADSADGAAGRLNYSLLGTYDAAAEAERKGDDLTSMLSRAGDAADDTAGSNRDLARDTSDATLEFDDLSDAAATVDDALDDLKDRYRDLTNDQRSVRDATVEWEASLDDLSASVEDNGTTLNTTTEKGRTNIGMLSDAQRAAEDHALAVLDETGSIDAANKVLDQHRDDLYDTMIQAGYSEEAAKEYTEEIKRIPDDAKTRAEFDRAAAREAIGAHVDRIEDVPDYADTYGRFFADRSALSSWITELNALNKTITTRGVFKSSGGPSAYADGTDYHPGGPAWVNDDPTRGIVGELLDLPTGTAVTTSTASVDLVTAGVVQALRETGAAVGRDGGASPQAIREAMEGLTFRGQMDTDGRGVMTLQPIDYA